MVRKCDLAVYNKRPPVRECQSARKMFLVTPRQKIMEIYRSPRLMFPFPGTTEAPMADDQDLTDGSRLACAHRTCLDVRNCREEKKKEKYATINVSHVVCCTMHHTRAAKSCIIAWSADRRSDSRTTSRGAIVSLWSVCVFVNVISLYTSEFCINYLSSPNQPAHMLIKLCQTSSNMVNVSCDDHLLRNWVILWLHST